MDRGGRKDGCGRCRAVAQASSGRRRPRSCRSICTRRAATCVRASAMGRMLRERQGNRARRANARQGMRARRAGGSRLPEAQAIGPRARSRTHRVRRVLQLVHAPICCSGAATREVDPDVTVGVHSARVTMNYQRRPRAAQGGARTRGQPRDRAAGSRPCRYVVAMGIDRGLLDLIKTVKFEQMHALKRDELVRFGIDKRELVETNWRFTDRGRMILHRQDRAGARPQGAERHFERCAGGSVASDRATHASRLFQEQRQRKLSPAW